MDYHSQHSYNADTQMPPKKKGGFGITILKCFVIAIIFGAVAGATFIGVTFLGEKVIDKESNTEAVRDTQNHETNSDVKLETTETGEAADLVDVSGIVNSVMPSIVAITNTTTTTYYSFWGGASTYPSESCGSGIIISQDEEYIYIATNNHVVEGADTLTMQFFDGTTAEGEVKGTAAENDLAVVRVSINEISSDSIEQIKVASIGESTDLKVGEPAIAIGNALGYGQSVTTGVISALGRTVTTSDTTGATTTNSNLIQTDAAINPGNSGGALLNMQGAVIGINSIKYSSTNVEGIGYAIPITDAMTIIDRLILQEGNGSIQGAYLGIQGQDMTSDLAAVYEYPQGVYVDSVISGSPAERAGIASGDIIAELDGQSIATMSQLKERLAYYASGDTVSLVVYRGGNKDRKTELSVTLGQNSLGN